MRGEPMGTTRGAGGEAKKRGINPLFAGIVIGMVLGVSLALALALYLNREKNVFVEKTEPVTPLPAAPKSTVPPIASTTGQAGRPDALAEKPRFDFYQILPGDSRADHKDKGSEPKPDVRHASVPPAKAPEVVRPAPVPTYARGVDVKPSTEEYFLQAGAFQNQSEAENMRAKVAFAGFQASVRNVNLPDKGSLYRVRLGPYKSLDETNRVKGVLGQSGIPAAIVSNKD